MASSQQPENRRKKVGRQLSFTTVDKDQSGTVELEEIQTALPDIPPEQVAEMFHKADLNKDGHLDRQEYKNFLSSIRESVGNFAERIVLPKKERTSSRLKCGFTDSLGSPRYEVKKKFPVFILLISLVELLFHTFLNYEAVQLALMFYPLRRYEIWRFLTVMLVHSSWSHLIGNLQFQIILGCLLETIHHWKRVAILYFIGVIFGTLASSVIEPWRYALGASGGVYCLLVAHLATIILNWSEMEYAPVRCFCLVWFIVEDVRHVFYDAVINGNKSNTCHAGHFGGALAGLLIGLNVLKNFEQRDWEVKLQKVCRILAIVLFLLAVIGNVGLQIYYFKSDPSHFADAYEIAENAETSAAVQSVLYKKL